MVDFTHLHVHTHYSILDGMCESNKLVAKAKELGMKSLAITDHGVMYGVLEFRNICVKQSIKPILGCEFYVNRSSMYDKDKNIRDNHLILLAKNFTGYQNLIKLDSMAFDEKAFYRHARIDKQLLFAHSQGLICSSACVAGEIPQLLLNDNIKAAEQAALEYKSVFGEDYYIEIQNHFRNEEQQKVLPLLIDLAKRLDIKVIATNDVHFINKEDFQAHRILICVSTGKKLSEQTRLSYTGEEYLKSGDQMAEIFSDIPQAISNTNEVADKIEVYDLERAPILPVFDIPKEFGKIEDTYNQYSEQDLKKEILLGLDSRGKIPKDATEQEKEKIADDQFKAKGGYDKLIHTKFDFQYLKYLTIKGAKLRYGDPIPDNVVKRLDMELDTIEWMGFPGYFLIVQDFINYSREHLGVIIGPGRGSAAGSVVAYCLGITKIEPLKYDLLFERFLNPDRISLPDIDVDFDNEGRAKALQYVQEKYGSSHVAQITTFGTMAAKNSIKDVARVLEMSIAEANRISGYIPAKPGISLQQAIYGDPKKGIEPSDQLLNIVENGTDLQKAVIKYATQLEGTIRNTGVHACGVIIGPDDISNYVPVSSGKDMKATQFEGKLIESVGMIKMDFLGLINLSIIKDACENIKKSKGIDLDIDAIDLNDPQTLEIFAKGDTLALFQFESAGMQQYLKELKPNKFEDLIAMNALYRPGPMAYIPDFIKRKHGQSKIEYTFEQMSKYLEDTYGITVYQEQVMQLSRLLANFTPGQADMLRKAMGKKKKDVMAQMKEKFDKGCKDNGLDKEKTDNIWKDWEKFAEYAFNKSHATCYAYVAFQTGYLKAHYFAEYMSSVLTHNLNDIKKITKYINDCQQHNVIVAGPNVNESDVNFMVNHKGEILFGLAAIKSIGSQVAQAIIEERQKNGQYSDAIDFIIRNNSSVNRKSIEALVKSGAFDCFSSADRAQYLALDKDNKNECFIDKLIRHCSKMANHISSAQSSLFGETLSDQSSINFPSCKPMELLEKLNYEKEMVGFYISGHPLDNYNVALKTFVHNDFTQLEDIYNLYAKGQTVLTFGGLITKVYESIDKRGNKYARFTVEDRQTSYEFALFSKDYATFCNNIKENYYVFIKGRIVERGFRNNNQNNSSEPKELEFKIDKLEQLNDILDSYSIGINFVIETDKLNEQLIEKITSIAKENPGNAILNFAIINTQENDRFSLQANINKIKISNYIKNIKPLLDNKDIADYNIITRA